MKVSKVDEKPLKESELVTYSYLKALYEDVRLECLTAHDI